MEGRDKRIHLSALLCIHIQDITLPKLRLSLSPGVFTYFLFRQLQYCMSLSKYIFFCPFVSLIHVCLVLQIWLPRIIQALFAAFADVKFFYLIRTLERRDVAKWTVRSSPRFFRKCTSYSLHWIGL